MLTIIIDPEKEYFNPSTNEFLKFEEKALQLEHSLISLKKWEQKWHKPFLGKQEKTPEELTDYIRCMTINPVKDPRIFQVLTREDIAAITEYIMDPMTATWFSNNDTVGAAKTKNETVTAEIIYYWMIELGVPVEFQKWHLNQLLTLIKVISLKRTPPKKMSSADIQKQYRALNAQRRAKLNTKG